MVDIWTRNFDYILFLYALSLFVLSSVCFIRPNQEREDNLSFHSFGLFALFQGVGEWMNIFSYALGDSYLFFAIRLLVFITSYFFLLRFASRGTHILFLRPVSRWVYLFLAVFFLFSFIRLGPEGTLSTVHFFFALFVGVYCALTVYLYSYKEKTGDCLRFFSLFLAAYFALRGLVTHKSAFFISSWVNYTSFSGLFGFPVQLALFVLIFAAVCVLLVSVYRAISEMRAKYSRRISTTVILFTLLILIALVFAGSVFTFYWSAYTKHDKEKIMLSRIKSLSIHINSITTMAEHIARSLAVSDRAKRALKYRDSLTIKQLNSLLDSYVESFGVSVCYVIDDEGLVIATSNRNSSDSFFGKNYGFHPYFKDALRGKTGGYFALGATSKKRGFYASYPVQDEWGNVLGVSVVKVNIGSKEDIFKFFNHAFLVSPEGIIFMSSKKQYLFRSLYPVENIYKHKLMLSRQFGKVDLNPLLEKECFEGDKVLLNNNVCYVSRTFIGYGGWSIVVLWHNRPILVARFFCISTTLFIVIPFLLFAAVLIKKEEIFDKISRVFSEYQAILKATGGVIIISVDTEGQILSSNSGAERILGYEEYELKGKNIVDCIFIKDDVDNYAGIITKETGKLMEGFYALVEKAKHNIITHRAWSLVKKDKTRVLVDLSIAAKRGRSGEITGFIFTAADITVIKRIQEELNNEKSRITMCFDIASVIMLMFDKEGRVVFINKTGCETLGYGQNEIIGKDWFDNFVPDDERDSVRDIFNKLIQGKESGVKTYTNYVLTKTGKRVILWHNVVIYDDSGEVTGILSSGDDVTERIEKEEELKAKIDEFERFQKFVVDRELKMKELKKRIRELEDSD